MFVYRKKYQCSINSHSIFGRPSEVELLTLIDRRFSRHLPIQPDYRGRQVDAINNEKVLVKWQDNDGGRCRLFGNKLKQTTQHNINEKNYQ